VSTHVVSEQTVERAVISWESIARVSILGSRREAVRRFLHGKVFERLS
jgi:hypothetical protein